VKSLAELAADFLDPPKLCDGCRTFQAPNTPHKRNNIHHPDGYATPCPGVCDEWTGYNASLDTMDSPNAVRFFTHIGQAHKLQRDLFDV